MIRVTLSDEDIAEAGRSFDAMIERGDANYKLLHPGDARSVGERVDAAWHEEFNGGIPLDLAVCPYCGIVPALNEDRDCCCKLGRWLSDAVLDAEQGQWLDRVKAAVGKFGKAIADNDSFEAEEAATELIRITGTKNLEDAFVTAHLWPKPSCGGRHCFETPTRAWHAPNWCAAVDGHARDMKEWRDRGEIGSRPSLRRISEGEPRLLAKRTDEENRLAGEHIKQFEVDRERRLGEMYGRDVVRKAREGQRAHDLDQEQQRAERGNIPSVEDRKVPG